MVQSKPTGGPNISRPVLVLIVLALLPYIIAVACGIYGIAAELSGGSTDAVVPVDASQAQLVKAALFVECLLILFAYIAVVQAAPSNGRWRYVIFVLLLHLGLVLLAIFAPTDVLFAVIFNGATWAGGVVLVAYPLILFCRKAPRQVADEH